MNFPAVAAVWLLAMVPAAGAACPPPAGDLVFSLSEDGDPVGRLRVRIGEQEAGITIRTEIDIRVNVLFVIPILVYRHSSIEVWADGAFRRFSGVTVDNGREFAVTVSAQDEWLARRRQRRRPGRGGLALDLAAVVRGRAQGRPPAQPPQGPPERDRRRLRGPGSRWRAGWRRRYDVTRAGRLSRVWYGPDGIAVKADIPTKRGSLVTVVRE